MVRPIRSVHFALAFGISRGDQIIDSSVGNPIAKQEASLEWGAEALNMAADLVVETHSAPDGGTPEEAATKLRTLSAKLMDTSAGPPSKADAKLALKLGASALKLGAKVMASTEVGDVSTSEDFSSGNHTGRHAGHSNEFVDQSAESASLEWSKSRIHGKQDGEHDKQADVSAEAEGAHARSEKQRNDNSGIVEPHVLESRDLLQNALSAGGEPSFGNVLMAARREEDVGGEQDRHRSSPKKTIAQHQQRSQLEGGDDKIDTQQFFGMVKRIKQEKHAARPHRGVKDKFVDGAAGSAGSAHRQQHAGLRIVEADQACSFTLTLSRSNGDTKDFNIQVTSAIDDTFRVEGCSQHGCDAKGFCAHQCMKHGSAGINIIKNQNGEEVGYGNCCGETNVVVHTEGCGDAPLDSEVATDLAHRFPGIATKVIRAAVRRASGDVRIATEELRNLAPPAPAPRLRRSTRTNFKEEVQTFSQPVAPFGAIDQMTEQAQQEQPTAALVPEVADPALKLVVKHMPRTGSTLLQSVLSQMLGQHNLVQYVDESTPLNSAGENNFVISTMRNPCDWYVSLWASAPRTDRELLNVQYGSVDDDAPFFDPSNANRTKFSKWLNWAQGGDPSGNSVMSLRYWESLVARTSAQGYSTTTLGSYTKGYEGRADVNTGLQSFVAENPVDCWVSDENFAADAKHCLTEYEERSGVSLEWEPFYKRLGGKGGRAVAKFESLQRKSCGYYYDEDVAASVLSSDDHLFKAFHFDTCCGPAK